MRTLFVGFSALVFASALPVFAGTLITANLPANTAIINIYATQDGAAGYNGDQSLWYHPFGGAAGLLEYFISPGTYSFRAINPADAARLYPALTQSQTNEIFTAWTYNSPWVLDYLVFDSAAQTNFSLPQLFDGCPDPASYSSAAAAYAASLTNGYNNLIRVGQLGRDSKTLTTTFTFTNFEALIFVVPDYGLYDNAGGVSVLVSPAPPMLPVLRIARGDGGGAVVSWPTNNADGFLLQQSPSLSAPNWTDSMNAVTVANGTNEVTIDPASGIEFFRLAHP